MEVANGYGREGTGVVFAILDTNGNYLYKQNLFYIVLNNFLEKTDNFKHVSALFNTIQSLFPFMFHQNFK